jgi:hypothetical protein
MHRPAAIDRSLAMNQTLKHLVLTASTLVAIASPLSATQAQTGYDYLFWPFFTATPAPARIQVPVPVAAPAAPIAVPRHVQTEYVHEETEVRYARAPEIARPAYIFNPQAIMLGVGY